MIDQVRMLIQFGAYGFGAIGLACFVLLAVAYQRNQRKEEDRLKRARAEIADMTLLFKTMRDIIKQQKSIAREFNREIDGKMIAVKHLLEQGIQRNEKLFERQQELTAMIRDAKEELASVQRQARFLRDDETAAERATHKAPHVPHPETKTSTPGQRVKALPPEPTPAVSEDQLAGTGVTQAPFSEWVGIDFQDFGENKSETSLPKVTPPEPPEDPEAARQAFRALLDMDDAAPSAAEAETNQDNMESGSGLHLRKRVSEYSEAGMTVPEIARELGIGKGEVRLALSLAKQKHT